MDYFAHKKDDENKKVFYHKLEDHINSVAELSSCFSSVFSAEEWGYFAGLWHDIGKYSKEFQRRLSGENIHVDHSSAGAQHVYNKFPGGPGKLLAYVISGHHAGLLDGKSYETSSLNKILSKNLAKYGAVPNEILNIEKILRLPEKVEFNLNPFKLSVFIRMLFSCLVDADYLDTEYFFKPQDSAARGKYPSLEELQKRLNTAMSELSGNAPDTKVNQERNNILNNCLQAANIEPGIFSLTVPTGGGKTLSSLAFAIKHALKFGLRRIIYVSPFTSIIEQNADVFRGAVGDDAIIEHHSAFESGTEEDRKNDETKIFQKLACENWDAPLIVTTGVQFFESLFNNRPSKCRKIHNIAKSVIILDEAQTLPVPLLKPCMKIIIELSSTYGSTIVLCTATQPALIKTDEFKAGIDNVKEIISDPKKLYKSFRRVKTTILGKLDNESLAERLIKHDRVLCVVNTRRQAREIFNVLSEKGDCIHLSALMCPEHRSEVFDNIRTLLENNKTCRVISTQLIEAGVNVDFPVVYRASAGIDSIAQAAGRCNREGKLKTKGEVFIFTPDSELPPGFLKKTAETAEIVIRHHDDPLDLDAVNEYFRRLYWMENEKLDEYGIISSINECGVKVDIPFNTIAEKFKFIKDYTIPVIVPWKKGIDFIRQLKMPYCSKDTIRRLQRYTVNVHPRTFDYLSSMGYIECIHESFRIITDTKIYKEDVGLSIEEIDNLLTEPIIV